MFVRCWRSKLNRQDAKVTKKQGDHAFPYVRMAPQATVIM